jgi:hypothetical protein
VNKKNKEARRIIAQTIPVFYTHTARPSKRHRMGRNAEYFDQTINPHPAASYTHFVGSPGGPHKKRSSLQKWDERLQQMARARENMAKICQPIVASQLSAAGLSPRFEPEVIVARACKCLTDVTYAFIPDPYTGSCEVPIHQCGQHERMPPPDPTKLRERIGPRTLRLIVESWLGGGPVYLVAYRMSEEQVSTIAGEKYLTRFQVDGALIETERDDDIGSHGSITVRNGTARYRRAASCIFRAILACDEIVSGNRRHDRVSNADRGKGNNTTDPYGWIPLTEDELMDFLTKARASGLLICVVKNSNGNKSSNGRGYRNQTGENNSNYYYYYIRIVSRYQIAVRNSAEWNELIQKSFKEFFASELAAMKLEDEEDEMIDKQAQAESWEIDPEGPYSEPSTAGLSKTAQPTKNESHPGRLEEEEEGTREEELPRQESQQSHERRNDDDHDYDPLIAVDDGVVGSFGEVEPPPIDNTGEESSKPHNIRHFGIWQVFGGLQGFESCYLGLEVEKDVMRVWGFPGNACDIKGLAPAGQQNLRLGTGSVRQYDVDDMIPVFKGFEYESRSLSNFTDPNPPFEHVEQSPRKTIPVSEEVMAINEDFWCTIESVKPDEIIFTFSEEANRLDNLLDSPEYFGRYRLARLEPDEPHAHDRAATATNGKKVWQLSKLS